jgi:predicted nucleotidyltransferase component of viral defense system
MHEETLILKTKEVLEKIQNETLLQEFYLAGGTALALQLGHRKSVDLDFFSTNIFNVSELISNLQKFNPVISQQNKNSLDLYIDDVKVSFLEYRYPLLEKLISYNNIFLAHEMDIACMKITAISQRGTKKDFIDLYFLLKKYSLEELLLKFAQKYQGINYQKVHILKSLVYFEDAEGDPDPEFIIETDWNKVKEFFIAIIK